MKDTACPHCKLILGGRKLVACLCTVTPNFCDECVQNVLNNYTCPVCSVFLPARVMQEVDADSYAEILKKFTKNNCAT